MGCLFIAVILTVSQTSSPVPRKTADNPASTSHATKNQTKSEKAPANAPTPSESVLGSEKEKNSTKQIGKNNTRQTVSISELPPVAVHRDWVDHLTWILALGLVLVGGLGLLAAYRTLKSIETQGRDITKAADAALLNAKAVINSERAWIHAELVEDGPKHKLKVTNHGKTPAEIFMCVVGKDPFDTKRLDIVNNPPDPNQEKFNPDKMAGGYCTSSSRFLASGESDFILTFDMSNEFDEWPEIKTGEKTGMIHIRVRYYDVLSIDNPRPIRETSILGMYGRSRWLSGFQPSPSFSKYT